jgi:hypothetical protein
MNIIASELITYFISRSPSNRVQIKSEIAKPMKIGSPPIVGVLSA